MRSASWLIQALMGLLLKFSILLFVISYHLIHWLRQWIYLKCLYQLSIFFFISIPFYNCYISHDFILNYMMRKWDSPTWCPLMFIQKYYFQWMWNHIIWCFPLYFEWMWNHIFSSIILLVDVESLWCIPVHFHWIKNHIIQCIPVDWKHIFYVFQFISIWLDITLSDVFQWIYISFYGL